MRLFIAEKPELAQAIVDGLGGGQRQGSYYDCGDDYVTWCIGHMLKLFDFEDYNSNYAKWSLDDLPIHETPIQYKPDEDPRKQLDAVISLIDRADSVVHAGDPDPEGQLIVDELLEYCRFDGPVERFMTNDNTLKLVQKALANMTDNSQYYSLYQSAYARNVGDQLYGFNMTRAYTMAAQAKGYDGTLNVGRVQTPILGLVVARDRAHESHEKQFYYEVIGDFNINGHQFPARFIPGEDAPLDDKNRINDKNFASDIAQKCSGKDALIASLNTGIKEASAPLPYNMLKLQADAAKQFNYKPDEVMKITQDLREKYKLITYNGSDCQYLNEEQHADAPNVLAAISQTASQYADIVGCADPDIKSRAFNNKNVSAHHAIIPTEATAIFEELTEKQRNIYLLIAKAYIAQFYPKQKYQDTSVLIDCDVHSFGVRSKVTTEAGWRVLYSKEQTDEESDDEDIFKQDLSKLETYDSGKCLNCEVHDKVTKPLPLYTMSTLLTDLTRVSKYIKNPKIKQLLIDKDKDKKGEHGGIGTSRTRDQIIKKIFDNGFLTEKGKKIVSTDIGRQFHDLLPEVATRPDMTALWHEQQSMIEKDEYTADAFIENLMSFITEQINSVKANGLSINIETIECPKCKEGHLKKRKGKNGLFWGCSRYPDCDMAVPNKAGKPDFKSLETHPCPACDKPMKRRKGKNGFFWGCTGFPECKKTFPDKRGKPDTNQKEKPTIEPSDKYKCGNCNKPLSRRPAKSGKGFWWGCTGYPDCKTTYKDQSGTPDYNS